MLLFHTAKTFETKQNKLQDDVILENKCFLLHLLLF